ncbi:hypothetical protein [Streptomyces sp. NPDC093097]|uniref:hypothetical protein n=1 Tax=Streptomyces sp. NPDC093097 TaxID=3366027 RepID=UPI00382D8AD0
MTTPDTPTDAPVTPGDRWLLAHSPAPTEARRLWSHDRLAPVRATAWRVAQGRCLRSLEAIRPLKRAGLLGPVLVDPADDAAWWLVADDAEDHLADIPVLTLHPAGWLLYCPPADRHFGGRYWLERPDGSDHLTDPLALGTLFSPAGRRLP